MKFNDSLCNKFKFVQKSRKDEGFALCTLCGSDFSVPHGGQNDVSRNNNTSKHKGYVDTVQQQWKLTDFDASWATANLDQKVVEDELLFCSFLAKQNLPLSIAN